MLEYVDVGDNTLAVSIAETLSEAVKLSKIRASKIKIVFFMVVHDLILNICFIGHDIKTKDITAQNAAET